MVDACNICPENKNKYLKQWVEFIKMRDTEDYIPHSKSAHRPLYRNLFDWRND